MGGQARHSRHNYSRRRGLGKPRSGEGKHSGGSEGEQAHEPFGEKPSRGVRVGDVEELDQDCREKIIEAIGEQDRGARASGRAVAGEEDEGEREPGTRPEPLVIEGDAEGVELVRISQGIGTISA